MYRLIVVMGTVAAACLALGCGSSDEAATATGAVTKSQFIHRAEKVCSKIAKEQETELASWAEEHPGGPKEAQDHFKDVYGKIIVPFMRQMVGELEQIEVPPGDESQVAEMTQGLHKAIRAIEAKGPDGAPESTLFAFRRAALAYGLTTCPSL